MTMTHTTVTVDVELLQQAREEGINVSKLLRDILKLELTNVEKDTYVFEKIIKDLEEKDIEIHSVIAKLKERKYKIELEEKASFEGMSRIPEIQNISIDDLNDTQLMVKIIDTIRMKYPEHRRLGIGDIKKFVLKEVIKDGSNAN